LVFINYENAEDMALDFKDVESLEKIVFIRLLKDRDKKYGKCDKKDQKDASINFSLHFGLYILILHTRRKIRIFFEIDHISSKTCLLVLVYSMALLHQHLPDVLNVYVSL
jgi:hypothetical protein